MDKGVCLRCSTFWICIILAITIVTVIIVEVASRPSRFSVFNASIYEFNLTKANTLRFNLEVDISVRNPNHVGAKCYNEFGVGLSYKGEQLINGTLPGFCQGSKNTTVFFWSFGGVAVLQHDVADFYKEKAAGFFNVGVEIFTGIKSKIGLIKTRSHSPKIKCELRIPVVATFDSRGNFTRTKCHG